MPIYNSDTKVIPNASKVYVGDQLVYQPAPSGPTVTTMTATLPNNLGRAAHCYHNGKIYIFGGQTSNGQTPLRTIYIYDIATDTLTTSNTQLPAMRSGGFAIPYTKNNVDYIAVFGGAEGTGSTDSRSDIYIYNIANDTITNNGYQMYNTYSVGCFYYYPGGNEVFIIGGSRGLGRSNSVSQSKNMTKFNLNTNSASSVNAPKLDVPCANGSSVYTNGYLYTYGGNTGSTSVYTRYKIDNSSITTYASAVGSVFPKTHGTGAAVIGNDWYIFGGDSSQNSDKLAILKIDITTQTGDYVNVSLPETVTFPMVETDGTDIYIIGGYGQSAIYKFTP